MNKKIILLFAITATNVSAISLDCSISGESSTSYVPYADTKTIKYPDQNGAIEITDEILKGERLLIIELEGHEDFRWSIANRGLTNLKKFQDMSNSEKYDIQVEEFNEKYSILVTTQTNLFISRKTGVFRLSSTTFASDSKKEFFQTIKKNWSGICKKVTGNKF